MTPKNLTPQPAGQYILYKDVKSRIVINVLYENNDVWLTQLQMASLFHVSRENICLHTRSVYKMAELQEKRTFKKFLIVQTEGSRTVRRNIAHYNMDMIVAVGYRIKSPAAMQFRKWVSQRCKQVIIEKQKKVPVKKKA